MVYLSGYDYVYHFKNLGFLIINLVILQIMFYVPFQVFYKDKMNWKFIISVFFFLFFYFLIYMDYLERFFAGMKMVNYYLIILAILIIYSMFNYFLNGKDIGFQFYLFSYSLFMMLWFLVAQYSTFWLYDRVQMGSFFTFYGINLFGAYLFIQAYRGLKKRVHPTKRRNLFIGCFYYAVLLTLNLKEIMLFSFKENFIMIVAKKGHLASSIINRFSNRIRHLYWDMDFHIFSIVLFIVVSCIPAIIVIQLLVKKQQDKEIINLQSKREDELKKYIQMIESINQETRQLQHDIKNVLSSLGMYIYQEQVNIVSMRNYYDQVNQDFGLRRITKIPNGKLTHLKNPEILGLVLDKLMRAKELDIQLNLEIEEAIAFPSKGLVPIVRILAILLDNALEESQKYPGAVVRLAFVSVGEKQLLTMVENYTMNSNFIGQYLAGTIQSDKGEGRGQGLSIIQSLIKENKQLNLDCKQTNQLVLFSFLVDGKG